MCDECRAILERYDAAIIRLSESAAQLNGIGTSDFLGSSTGGLDQAGMPRYLVGPG